METERLVDVKSIARNSTGSCYNHELKKDTRYKHKLKRAVATNLFVPRERTVGTIQYE